MHDLGGARDGQTPLDLDEAEQLVPSWIVTRADLDRAEQESILGAIVVLSQRRPGAGDVLTEGFLRDLHRRMFGAVWSWAGTYRRSDKNIGIPWPLVPQRVGQLLADTQYWAEHGVYGPDELAVRFHHGLVAIHPFPNGNGRHARLAADLLAEALGRERFSWGRGLVADPDRARSAYIAALRAADAGELADLLAFARM